MNILKIKREELLPSLVAFATFAGLNFLMTQYHQEAFTKYIKGGFWSLFWNNFHVSGFDAFTYMTLSKWDVYYVAMRHPLLALFWWPFAQLNSWLAPELQTNCAVYIVAVVMTLFAYLGWLCFYRTLRQVMQLRQVDACLLSAFFYSFGYIMLSVMVPDHFGISLFFLMLTLYLAGRLLRDGRAMKWWQGALLFFLTAGVTLSNGLKVALAALFTNGCKVFRPKFLLLAAIVPTIALYAIGTWEVERFVKPMEERGRKIAAANEKKHNRQHEKVKKFSARVSEVQGTKDNNRLGIGWYDLGLSRTESLVDNVFGESLQLHEVHRLEDIYFSRPIFVKYTRWINYAVEAIIVLLFLVGIWAGRRQRLLQMVLLWTIPDIIIHLGLGFGLNEVYIMTAHWAFIIPIAVACLLQRCGPRTAFALRATLLFLTLFLFVHNSQLIYKHMV